MLHWGTWVTGHCGDGLMVGWDDLSSPLQSLWFYDFVIRFSSLQTHRAHNMHCWRRLRPREIIQCRILVQSLDFININQKELPKLFNNCLMHPLGLHWFCFISSKLIYLFYCLRQAGTGVCLGLWTGGAIFETLCLDKWQCLFCMNIPSLVQGL